MNLSAKVFQFAFVLLVMLLIAGASGGAEPIRIAYSVISWTMTLLIWRKMRVFLGRADWTCS